MSYKQGNKIIYEKWDIVGLNNCQFIKEIDKDNSGHRRALFLCGTCGIRTFKTRIDSVKGNYTKSCGCKPKDPRPEIDLTGKQFGRLTVLYVTPKKKKSERIKWHCVCNCKNRTEVDVFKDNLINGLTVSCGCYNKEQAGNYQTKDLTGKRFGSLVVLKRNGSKRYKNNHTESLWSCICDCDPDKIKDVTYGNLINGHVTSCGCKKMSAGEGKIKECLIDLNIKYIQEYKLKNSKQKFDFYLPDFNIAIEYDGEQHFKSVKFFGGEEGLKKRQERDIKKNKYCKDNNIQLIRIPYTDFQKINPEYLQNKIFDKK